MMVVVLVVLMVALTIIVTRIAHQYRGSMLTDQGIVFIYRVSCIHFGKRKEKRTNSAASLPPWKVRHN